MNKEELGVFLVEASHVGQILVAKRSIDAGLLLTMPHKETEIFLFEIMEKSIVQT